MGTVIQTVNLELSLRKFMSDVYFQASWRDFHIYGANRTPLIFGFVIMLNLVELLAPVRL
jgi:hypothetical protein